MKYPCCSQILSDIDSPCIYDGVVDDKIHAYGQRFINGKKYLYHYRCYLNAKTEIIHLNNFVKKKLGAHLTDLWYAGTKEHWLESVLSACGYRPKEEK